MKFSLFPKEVQYFDLLEQATRYLVEGAELLDDLANHFVDVEAKINRLQGIEHACDEVSHTTLNKLNKTFITPMDREDIHSLILALDDVLDMTTEAATRLLLFRVTKPRPPVLQLSAVIVRQTQKISEAVRMLRDSRQFEMAGTHCIELHRLENEADEIMKKAVADLFDKETNAIELLRWKEIYETLEAVTDCAEDAANVIQGIVVKMA